MTPKNLRKGVTIKCRGKKYMISSNSFKSTKDFYGVIREEYSVAGTTQKIVILQINREVGLKNYGYALDTGSMTYFRDEVSLSHPYEDEKVICIASLSVLCGIGEIGEVTDVEPINEEQCSYSISTQWGITVYEDAYYPKKIKLLTPELKKLLTACEEAREKLRVADQKVRMEKFVIAQANYKPLTELNEDNLDNYVKNVETQKGYKVVGENEDGTVSLVSEGKITNCTFEKLYNEYVWSAGDIIGELL